MVFRLHQRTWVINACHAVRQAASMSATFDRQRWCRYSIRVSFRNEEHGNEVHYPSNVQLYSFVEGLGSGVYNCQTQMISYYRRRLRCQRACRRRACTIIPTKSPTDTCACLPWIYISKRTSRICVYATCA